MNEFFTNAIKSFKKNPITTLGIVVIAVVLMFVLNQVYNHIPTSIKDLRVEMNQNYRELNEKINQNQRELNEKINQNQRELIEKINSNQNEIKNLIIEHLIEKK